MGFSEGAIASVRTKLADFRGVIATSLTCTNAKAPGFDGVFVTPETPVLTLSHESDPVYTAGGTPKDGAGLPGDPGYRLHAYRLRLAHPATGRRLDLECAPPPELRD